MANQIRIHTACEIVNDNSVANEGTSAGDYTNLNLDVHADSRSWGGNYNISTAYDSTTPAVCCWKNVVVSDTSASGGLGDNTWNEGSTAPTGTAPATAHVVAVEYVSELGTATVTVQINSEVHALLVGGDAVVIPLHAGEAKANIEVFSAEYSDGVNEATVNVMIAGV